LAAFNQAPKPMFIFAQPKAVVKAVSMAENPCFFIQHGAGFID